MARDYRSGLTQDEVKRSRLKYGDNVLTPPVKDPLWKQFLEKFEDPIIRILLIALLLSVAVSLYQLFTGAEGMHVLLEPLGIFVAVMLATTVGFVFELSANKKFDILNQTEDEQLVTVFRDGMIQRIERKDVVVGDSVVVETGDEVPADGTLMEAISLRVNESDLTGEPSCSKTTEASEFNEEATYPSNYICRGSSVMEGHGLFVVEKVGDSTEWGKVYRGAQIDNKVKTPLNEQLDRLGNGITIASYVIAGLIVVLRLLMYFIYQNDTPFNWMDFARYLLNTLMIAVTLVVVAVPEGLPMSVTLSLALSMKRMLETNNLVRKMHACETMGAATVICSDKTGTLTKNRMSLGDSLFYGLKRGALDDSEVGNLVAEGIAVNSTAFLDYSDKQKVKVVGNPTEGALLLWLFDHNVDFVRIRDKAVIVKQLPFTTKYKYMATVVKTPIMGEYVLYVKGAPEIIMKRCTTVRMAGGESDIVSVKGEVDVKLLEFQSKAMRTLGFAYKYLSEEGIKNTQAFVALTGNAETNILACLTAKRLGVRKTVAMVENLDYVEMAESLDIGTIINKKTVAASHIYQMMLDADVSNVRSLMMVDSDVAEFVAAEGSKVTKKPVKDLGLPFGVTIGGLVRNNEGILVNGNTQILPGDSVMVFCHEQNLKKIEKYFKSNTLW